MSKKHKKSSSHQSGFHLKQGQKPNHQSKPSAPHRKLPSAAKHAQPKPQNTVKQTQPSPYQITLAEDSDEDVSQIPGHQIQNQPAGTEGDDDEATGLTKLQSNLAAKLTGSRFRVLNEELYTTTSEEVRMNEVNNDNSTFSFWLSFGYPTRLLLRHVHDESLTLNMCALSSLSLHLRASRGFRRTPSSSTITTSASGNRRPAGMSCAIPSPRRTRRTSRRKTSTRRARMQTRTRTRRQKAE